MPDDMELDELLCFDLYAASRAMTALYRPLLTPLGLTYPQYLVLVVLWGATPHHSVSIKQLSESLQLDYGTLTPLLRRMEAGGLITRNRSETDERSVTIELTASGRSLKRKAKTIPAKICEGVGLAPDQARQLQHTLRALTTNALAG